MRSSGLLALHPHTPAHMAPPRPGYRSCEWIRIAGRGAAIALLALAPGIGGALAQTVTITATAGLGGTIAPSGAVVVSVGGSQSFSIAPDTGFFIRKLVVDGKALPAAPDYTFNAVARNHKIAARFKRNVYTLSVSATDGFRIKPSGTLRAPHGKSIKFKITTASPGVPPLATVDGVPVDLVAEGAAWTFTLIATGNHQVSVSLPGSPVAALSVEKSGEGTGAVTSDPAGIDCGGTCAADLPPGAPVVLTATADDGSVFAEWSGACAGTSPQCEVTPNAATTVGARFDLGDRSFLAQPRAEPASGKAPLTVSLDAEASGAPDPVAFFAWDWEGDGTWDSCNPDDPGNPALPCQTAPGASEHVYASFGAFRPTLLAETTTGQRSITAAGVFVHGTTSEELIFAALSAGTIDQGTALVYRIYADYGDTRLPAQFKGDDPVDQGETASQELFANWENLSPQAQSLLAPFMLPPAYAGSWYDQRQSVGAAAPRAAAAAPAAATQRPTCSGITSGWLSIPIAGVSTKVRVWWDQTHFPGHGVDAARILGEVNQIVWPKIKALMGTEPLDDMDYSANGGCDGGDSLLDIYLVDGMTRPKTTSEACGSAGSPAFIMVMPGITTSGLGHEIFHAFEYARKIGGCATQEPYFWWTEACAQWAMDYVKQTPPGDTGDQAYASVYLTTTPQTIEDKNPVNREYGAYLFPFYLARNYTPNLIRLIWDRMESDDESPFDAIDAVVGGGLEERWPEFARRAWNRAPYDQFFRWDQLTKGAKPTADIEVKGLAGMQQNGWGMDVSLPPLSSIYYRYTFPEDSARTVTFYNGLTWQLTKGPLPFGQSLMGDGYSMTSLDPSATKGARIQALLKVGGVWQPPQDWTNAPFRELCRDKKSERIEEMVLIFSNSDKTPGRVLEELERASTLHVTNVGCWEWTGKLDFERLESGVKQEWHVKDLRYVRVGPPPPPAPDTIEAATAASAGDIAFTLASPFVLTEGKLDYKISGTDTAGCTYSGGISGLEVKFPRGTTGGTFNVFENVTGGAAHRGIQLNGFDHIPLDTYQWKVCCPDAACNMKTGSIYVVLLIDPLFSKPPPRLQPAGDLIQGDGKDSTLPGVTGSWHLDAKREP